MDRSEAFDRLKDIAVDVLSASPDEIDEDTTFDDMDADSLDKLQLVTQVEDEFGLEVPDEDLESLESVGDVLDLIEKLAD